MWVIGYDSKDQAFVRRRDMSYWPLRHGSPLRDEPAYWVPSWFIPCLRQELSESADLYLAYLPNVPPPRRARFLLGQDQPKLELHGQLAEIELSHVALAVEFTYHHNWSSNAIERLRILYDSVNAGIPTVYALPESGIGLRGTERRGDSNVRQRALGDVLLGVCRTMVQENRPISLATVEEELRNSEGDDSVGLGETAVNPPDPKVPLFCRTMQDSFEIPCCTAQFDQVVAAVPTPWKMAGCQLASVYSVIRESMEYMTREGTQPTTESGIFDEHNRGDDLIMKKMPPTRRGSRRHKVWDRFHESTSGFPNGSLGIVTRPPQRHSCDHNYSLPAFKLGLLHFHPNGVATEDSFNDWIGEMETRNNQRSFGHLRSEAVPAPLLGRPLIITFRVSEYRGSRSGVDRWQNVDERTYSGKIVMIDMCATRSPVHAPDRPRAMSKSRKDRSYLLAADLPMNSETMFQHYGSNARFRNFVDFADILIFDDGGYLGRVWWDDDSPIQVF